MMISVVASLSVRALLFAALLALTGVRIGAQNVSKPVTLEGQFVCSECWFEADRKTTPYGNAADIQCARDCVVKQIPPAIAVKEGDEFKLYLIEAGQFKRSGEEWIEFIGKFVRVSGQMRMIKDRPVVSVDQFQVVGDAHLSASQKIGAQPELVLKDLFGVEQKLSSYRGKIVVLNFWATWCIPCRKEMPDLAAIQNDYAALGVQVVGAAADALEDRKTVLQFIKETRVNFPVWLGASSEHMAHFGLSAALPGTVVIGRDGKIVSVTPTVVTEAALRKELDRLLAADAVAIKNEIARADKSPTRPSLVPS